MILDIGAEIAETGKGAGALPLGQPMSPYIKTWLLDGQGRVAKENEEGMLHLTGPHLFKGYLGLSELTAEKLAETDRISADSVWPPGQLRAATQSGSVRIYNTSDRVRLTSSGRLE